MAKQRDKVRMSDAEVDAFLGESKSLNVASLGKDGAPHLTTLWFAVHDGKIMFETYGSSQKVVNLRRDPRIAVLCEAGETYQELRGVSVNGRAEIVDQAPRINELMSFIVQRNNPGIASEALGDHVVQMTRKRVVVVVHPERVVSWDHRKLSQS
jgi:PPOX class probable F420-dependent enzyme